MMFSASVLLIACLSGTILASQQCTSGSRDLNLILRSTRNNTGHWNLQAKLSQETDSKTEYREIGPVVVEIDQKTQSCEGKETVITIASLSSPPPLAGPGYQLYPGVGRYKLHPTKVTWEQARLACLNESAHLAIIESQTEADALADMFNRYKSSATYVAFIGFHDQYFEGHFLTVLGESLESTGYLRWSPSEPSGSRLYNCGCMYPSGLICDVDCVDTLSFICEQELF